jgi:trehalose 6-phosphate synthase
VKATRRALGVNGERLIFGVDRLDYTKGIPDRLKAFARLLERHPDWIGRVTMVQVGAPSRDHLKRYQELGDEVGALVDAINLRYERDDWKPIVYRPAHANPDVIATLYRAADVCVVSSLHDGMNLVAKEFIASRGDEQGVLVLSEFTGAARELEQAVLVNPFAMDAFADTLHAALLMTPEEQAIRMRALRDRVASHTVFDWAASLLTAASRMEAVSR